MPTNARAMHAGHQVQANAKRRATGEHEQMILSRMDDKFEQLACKLYPQARLLRAWALTGGVSARVTALEVELGGGLTKRMVVRQHGDVDRKRNPQIAADEFKLLQILQSVGLPAPAPYLLDQSGEV